MRLPGQTLSASQLLEETHKYVQERTAKSVVFLDITTHPRAEVRGARGHHDWDGSAERIWLHPALPRDAQEAVAAHELMHVLQKAEGFCQTASLRNSAGNPILPQITELGTAINSLVTDRTADMWAADRGFKVEEGLNTDALPRALRSLKTKEVGEVEHTDWVAYRVDLRRIAADVERGLLPQAPVLLRSEVKTQVRAVKYSGVFRRLLPFSLIHELEASCAEHWPAARSLGHEILSVVDGIDPRDGETSGTCAIAVIEYLGIPPALLGVKRALTDERVWPKPSGQGANPLNQNAPARYGSSGKVGRNERCPCGSGKKYKKCCGK